MGELGMIIAENLHSYFLLEKQQNLRTSCSWESQKLQIENTKCCIRNHALAASLLLYGIYSQNLLANVMRLISNWEGHLKLSN